MQGILSQPRRERIPPLELGGGNGAPLDVGGTLVLPLECKRVCRGSVHSREICFPCTASTFKPRIDSHHGATLDSPVGKPRGKATGPLIHARGSVTLQPQLGKRGHVHASLETRTDSYGETPEIPQDPCQHWRGILRFRHRLHTRSWAPASTERNPERPPSNSHGDWPFLRPPERVLTSLS